MCISAGQNGARLIKIAREEIGLQPRSKVILRHAQQDFDTISSELFLFSPFFACQGKRPLLSGIRPVNITCGVRCLALKPLVILNKNKANFVEYTGPAETVQSWSGNNI